MSTLLRNQLALTALSTLFLSACGLNAQQTNSTSAHTDADSTKMARTTNSWITAVQKHNNSGLVLRYRLDAKPVAGQPLAVQVEFSGVASDDAQIQMSPDKALSASMPAVAQKNSEGYRLALSKGQVAAHTLMMTPSENGMHFIRFQMSQSGQASAASIAIPVGDGPFATPTLGEVQTSPNGEKIVVMPAQAKP